MVVTEGPGFQGVVSFPIPGWGKGFLLLSHNSLEVGRVRHSFSLGPMRKLTGWVTYIVPIGYNVGLSMDQNHRHALVASDESQGFFACSQGGRCLGSKETSIVSGAHDQVQTLYSESHLFMDMQNVRGQDPYSQSDLRTEGRGVLGSLLAEAHGFLGLLCGGFLPISTTQ